MELAQNGGSYPRGDPMKVINMIEKYNGKRSVKVGDNEIAKKKEKKMNFYRKTAIIVGALFIIDLLMNMIGSTLIEVILDNPDYLIALSANKNQVITGVLLESISAICLVSIGFMIYPILKSYSETIARGYFSIRIIETVIAVGFVISHLLLFALSQEYVKAGTPDASHFQTLGALLIEGHDFSYQIYAIFYSLGSLMLFVLLSRTKLVPQLISIWGLTGAIVMLTGLVVDMYGSGVGMEIYGMPLGLCQIFLAIWLIIKGFNPIALES
jgi:hypothetical protein